MISPVAFSFIVLALSIAFALVFSIMDAETKNREHYFNDHRSRVFLRVAFFISMGLTNWHYTIASFLIFTALFDQLLNVFSNNTVFWYLGTEAKWDIFWGKDKKIHFRGLRIKNKLILRPFVRMYSLMPIYKVCKVILLAAGVWLCFLN